MAAMDAPAPPPSPPPSPPPGGFDAAGPRPAGKLVTLILGAGLIALVVTGVVALGCITVLVLEYNLSRRTAATDNAFAILFVIGCPIIGYFTLRSSSGSAVERPGLAVWAKGKVAAGVILLTFAALFVRSFNHYSVE